MTEAPQKPIVALARIGIAGAAVLLFACTSEQRDIAMVSDTAMIELSPSLAISASGQVAIAYASGDLASATAHVSVFDGTVWSSLGDGVPLQNDGVLVQGPQIAFQPDGTLLLKTKEAAGGVVAVVVRRWTGTAWELLGGPGGPLGAGGQCGAAHMALDSVGAPVIAVELPRIAAPPAFSLRRWDGATWAPFASDGTAMANTDRLFDFALDSTDRPYLLLQAVPASGEFGLVRWDGGTWQWLPRAIATEDLALDSSDAPLVFAPWGYQRSLLRFDGASWSSSPPTRGIDGDSFFPGGASIAADASGGAFVAWHEYPNPSGRLWPLPPTAVYVQRWTGAAWERVLGPLGGERGNTFHVQIAVGGPYTTVPVVAWIERDGSSGAPTPDTLFVRVPR